MVSAKLQEVKIGEKITWGNYQGEPILWRVLDKEEEKALLMSEKCLDAQPYHCEWEEVTWEDSRLRGWLNDVFWHAAFSEEEQGSILSTLCKNEPNPKYNTSGGNDTEDFIFLLSLSEAEKYFASDTERRARATEYAESKKTGTDSEGFTWWWLRSLGFVENCCAEVKCDGSIDYVGRLTYFTGCGGTSTTTVANGVRPAMWIRLDEKI